MALFSNTLNLFLKSLNQDRFSKVPEAIQKWHSSESGVWFGLGPSEQKVKVEELAQDIYELIILFEKDNEIKRCEPYQPLEGLFR